MGVVCDTMLALLGPSGDLVPESGVFGQRGARCTAERPVELVPVFLWGTSSTPGDSGEDGL